MPVRRYPDRRVMIMSLMRWDRPEIPTIFVEGARPTISAM
jgi:hypothetical protein